MHVIIIKHHVLHSKFVLFLNYILTICVMILKMEKWKIPYLYVILVKKLL